jgi:hypothetical protein
MGEGRMVVDLRNGTIWGFPTYAAGAVYPIDTTTSKGAVSRAIYLGRFDLDSMKPPE